MVPKERQWWCGSQRKTGLSYPATYEHGTKQRVPLGKWFCKILSGSHVSGSCQELRFQFLCFNSQPSLASCARSVGPSRPVLKHDILEAPRLEIGCRSQAVTSGALILEGAQRGSMSDNTSSPRDAFLLRLLRRTDTVRETSQIGLPFVRPVSLYI